MEFAIIGGSGFYSSGHEAAEVRVINTPYGPANVAVGTRQGREIAFITRHGFGHAVPPHQINYRANIFALKQLGVTCILASSSAGSLNENMGPGEFAALTQFLDFTKGRASTFFDGEDGKVVHVDLTEPYCPQLRRDLAKAAEKLGLPVHAEATYVCVEGPRFETPAEIRMFRKLGGDLVGMTNLPEVVLAREAEICYAAVAVMTNWAAGIGKERVSHLEVVEKMGEQIDALRSLFFQAIEIHQPADCSCRHAVEQVEVE